jgi:hypothetical protein
VQPPVLQGLLAGLLSGDPEVVVVDSARPADVNAADVVVMTRANPHDQDAALAVLYRSPRARVLAISEDARRSELYELRPHRRSLGELSRQSLLAAVRAAGDGA